MRHLSPAEYLIRCFRGFRGAQSGITAVARAVGRDRSTVLRWTYPASRGGANGKVPHDVQPTLLDLAEKEGLDLTAVDLIRGRDLPEFERAEAA